MRHSGGEYVGIRLPVLILSLALLCPAALVAADAPFEPVADIRIESDLTAHSIRIPAGVTVTLASDVILRADDLLIVEGRILAEQRLIESHIRTGIGVHLQAGGRIEIRGHVLPGDGSDGTLPGQPGGRGGDLVLDAPVILSDLDLIGGNGGHGGPGATGGNGGSVIVRSGRLLSLSGDVVRSATGGRGGDGGRGIDGFLGGSGGPGGDGGNGGEALAGTREDGDDGETGESGNDVYGNDGHDGRDGKPSENGRAGFMGFAAWGGQGGNGGVEGNATEPNGSGGYGGRGGDGGLAIAGDGGNGGRGGDCLNGTQAGPGGGGGYPDGEPGDVGFAGTAHPGSDGEDGESGEFCPEIPEQDENEEGHADGTWEDAYSWDFESVIPPDFGAFAQAFTSELTITGLRMFLTADVDGPGSGNPMTRVAPGLGFPEGWQPVSDLFGPTAALGISVRYSPHGACCYPDGCCKIRTRVECESEEGVFLGAGTNCSDAPCNPGLPDFRDHDIGGCVLTVTDQGILGFMDGSQTEGSGFVYPAAGANHLYIGSLWVGTDPGFVANRDYDADPNPEWVVAACPAGQVTDAAGGLGDQEFMAVFDAELYPGRDLVTTQMSSASVAGPAGDFVIIRYQIGNPGEEDIPDAYAGLFCDFDLNGTALDDTGMADPAGGLAVMTDGSGIHTAVRLLQSVSHQWPVRATLIHNPTFVFPNQYISDEDKYAFLAALSPEHVLLEGDVPDDHGALVSTGPFPLAAGETVEVAFAVIGGHSMEAILQSGESAETIYQSLTADAPEAGAIHPGGRDGALHLYQPAPNPTRSESLIRFAVEQRRDLRLEIFDVAGRRVSLLADRLFEAGIHQVNWKGSGSSGREVPAGIYFVKLSDPAGGIYQVRRISLLR